MTFRLSSNTVSKRRYGGGFSAPSGPAALKLPTVSGGVLTSDELYYYRTFLGNDTLTISDGPLDLEALVVGGGASGANEAGGGAGGLLLQALTLTPSAYPALIGAGGAINWPNSAGNNTTFAGLTALGGSLAQGNTGGSGTGAASDWQKGYGTPGQGNDGGPGGPYYSAGGGGGAGAAGGGGQGFRYGGNGGNGLYLPEWANATGTGVNGYYAGGGAGGGNWGQGTPGLGGGGQGGTDGYQQTASLPYLYGAANTGGGGGGRGGNVGGPGGSGIVIVRYLKTAVA